MSISPRVKAPLLTVSLGIISAALWDGLKKAWPAIPNALQFPTFLHLSDLIYSIVVAGIGVYLGSRFIGRSTLTELPALRPKIIPVRCGRTPDNRFGLFVRNDGEPAFDISVEEPVAIGTAKLKFWDRIYPGLTKEDGELFIESNIELANGLSLTGSALRDQIFKADLSAVTLKIKYRDLAQGWLTVFDVVFDFWGDGLRISAVRQERAPSPSPITLAG